MKRVLFGGCRNHLCEKRDPPAVRSEYVASTPLPQNPNSNPNPNPNPNPCEQNSSLVVLWLRLVATRESTRARLELKDVAPRAAELA